MSNRKLFLSFVLALFAGLFVSTDFASAHDNDPKSLSNPRTGLTGSGGNGPFPALRTVLLGRLTVEEMGGGGSVRGNDCWGWTDPVSGRKFAIYGLTNATSFVEVTDPTNPLFLGKLDTVEAGQNRSWRDIKVYNNHAYIVADGSGNDHGVQIFDLTELLTVDPESPEEFTASGLYSDISSSHNIAINEDTGYAYVVGARDTSGSRYYGGGLVILDLSDPLNITEAGGFGGDGYTHDVQVVVYDGPDSEHVGKEIAMACNEDTVTIVDVTDKSNTQQLSRIGYPDDGYSHQGWLSEDHRYFYHNDELDEYWHIRGPDRQLGTEDDLPPIPTKTHIWDVSDLDNPIYKGFFSGTEKTIDHNLYVKGEFIYQANYSSGMRILRIDDEDPSRLVEYGFFDSYAADNEVTFNGAWSVYPYFDYGDDDIIMISDRQGGLFIVQRLPEPEVMNVELNVGEDQRSTIESITLTFDGEVEFQEEAFTMTQRSTATDETFEPMTINVVDSFADGQTTATIQFLSHVRNDNNALVDGNYQLTLDADLVSLNGVTRVEDFNFGDRIEHAFYAFFGDSNRDRRVDISDLLPFRRSYRASDGDPDYDYDMDYEANGIVDVRDLLQFRIRYLEEIPFVFTSNRSAFASGSDGDSSNDSNAKGTASVSGATRTKNSTLSTPTKTGRSLR